AFLPKGCKVGDDDCKGVIRAPDTARALGLRDTDMKIISATFNMAIAPIIQMTTSSAQSGFIAGRQFTSTAWGLIRWLAWGHYFLKRINVTQCWSRWTP
ncbi:unnamed protein product, partial [Prorocentrum cordatum]